MTRLPVAATLCVLALCASAPAAERRAETPQTAVELVAASERPTPGRPFWLGLRFQLKPGWHIYWVNPGDSGGPPTVQWTLPPGVKAGEFEWPAPERFVLGPIVNYGYSGDVVLPLPVTIASDAARAPISVKAAVRWIACEEICVPGRATLEWTLPVPERDRSHVAAWKALVGRARDRVPQPAPSAWRAGAVARGDEFVLTVGLDRPAPSGATFFPLEVNQINESAAQKVSASERTLRITLKKSDLLQGLPKQLKGVVRLASGEAVVITAPMSVQ